MLDVIKKLDAATIKALAAATIPLLALIATLFGIDEKAFNIKADQVVQIVLALVTLGGIAWAAWARLFKPTPPLTQTALDATRAMIAKGELAVLPVPPKKQGGFMTLRMLEALSVVTLVGLVVGCTGTRAAYRAADSLPDQAYVVAEHYSAIVKQAADLAENPATPESVKDQLKAADNKARPLVLLLKDLAAAFQATRTAETQADLQGTLNQAVVAVADLIRAVKAARGEHARSTDIGACGAAIGRARTRIAGPGPYGGCALRFG